MPRVLGWLGLTCILFPIALICAVIAVAIVITTPVIAALLGVVVGFLAVEWVKRHVRIRFEDDDDA